MSKEEILKELIRTALAEDIGQGDITTLAIVDKNKNGQAQIIAKQDGFLSGIEIAKKTFSFLDGDIQFESQYKDGDKIKNNDSLLME